MLKKILFFILFFTLSLMSNTPDWAKNGYCESSDCAVGSANLKDGESVAIADALQKLNTQLGVSVKNSFKSLVDKNGEEFIESSIQAYTPTRQLGYKILQKYSDKRKVFVMIKYDPSVKFAKNESLSEFNRYSDLKNFCDKKISGRYCMSLGRMYEFGEDDLEIDLIKALDYYEKACKLDNYEGCVYAGDILEKDNKTDNAIKLFKKACENGYGAGCFKLAYHKDDELGKLKLYQQGCETNDATSCYLMGEIYELGLAGLKKNKERALFLYEKSCLLDSNSDGCALKGQLENDYANLDNLCRKNNARACAIVGHRNNDEKMLEKSSILGSPLGAYYLGVFNRRIDAEMLEKSCNTGVRYDSVQACRALADHYAGSKPEDEVMRLYAMACNHIFYDKEACKALYEHKPDLCPDNMACRELAASTNAATSIESAKKESPKTTTNNQDKSKRFYELFLNIGMGTTALGDVRELDNKNPFTFDGIIGITFKTTNKSIKAFISPYIGVNMMNLSLESKNRKYESKESNLYSAFKMGARAGLELYNISVYGNIFKQFASKSEDEDDDYVPINSLNGYGFGASYSFLNNMLSLGIEYNLISMDFVSKKYEETKTKTSQVMFILGVKF